VETTLIDGYEHPMEEMLEEFIFQRLTVDASENLVAHLLDCQHCQEAFEDALEFVVLAKGVLNGRSGLGFVQKSQACPQPQARNRFTPQE
jgi:hypothetical protein